MPTGSGYLLHRGRRANGRSALSSALIGFVLSTALALPAAAKIRIVASIPDLGSIASSVGGDRIEVASIARSQSDAHRVEVLPSYMVRVSRAEIYLEVGLGLDPWARQIIDGSHNGRLDIIDCSQGIEPLEKPTGRVDASMGDVHPDGNPHYWLDPANGARIARTIAEALGRHDPDHAAEYARNAEGFSALCTEKRHQGLEAAAALPVRQILTYHRSWSYLAHAFGLEVVGEVEPYPGIPPTGRHLADLVELIRSRQVPVLLVEPYFSDDAGSFLARETGIEVFEISPSCEGTEAGSYLAHFDRVIDLLANLGGSEPARTPGAGD